MKKSIKKILIFSLVMVLLLTVVAVPISAIEQSTSMQRFEDCLFYYRGLESNINYAYNQLKINFSTFGDVPIIKAPKISVYLNNSLVQTFSWYGDEYQFIVGINCDDNAQFWYLYVFDEANSTRYTYDLTICSVYCFKEGNVYPIIYTNNLTNWGNSISNALGEGFDTYRAFRIPSTEAILLPQQYYSDLGDGTNSPDYQSGYNDGYQNGLSLGKAEGFAKGQTDIVKTSSTLREFISAIFTAPSHFINTIFNFQIFGFNVAGIVRTIIALLILALVATFIIKLIL